MTEHNSPQEGRCRCGQVRFNVKTKSLITMACHCTGCQRMTASAFSLSSLYSSSSFKILEGKPVIGGLHGAIRHFFCPNCMSWLFTIWPSTRPEGVEEFVNVRAMLLDDAHSFRPFIETYTSEMLPWVRTPAVHSFEKFPPVEQFPALLAAFAEQPE